jgi:hypothetical protein
MSKHEETQSKRKPFFGIWSLLLTLLIPAIVLSGLFVIQPHKEFFEVGKSRSWNWGDQGFNMSLEDISTWLDDYQFRNSEVRFVNILDLMGSTDSITTSQAAPVQPGAERFDAPPVVTFEEDLSLKGVSCSVAKKRIGTITDRAVKESFDGEVFALETYLREASEALSQSKSELTAPRASCEGCSDEELVNSHPRMVQLRRGWMICPDGTKTRPREEALRLYEEAYGKSHREKHLSDADTFFFACQKSEKEAVNPEFQIGPVFRLKPGVFEAQARLDFPHPRVREIQLNGKAYFLVARSVRAQVDFNKYSAKSWVEGYVSRTGNDQPGKARRGFVADTGGLPELMLKQERPDCVKSAVVVSKAAPKRIKPKKKARPKKVAKAKKVRKKRVARRKAPAPVRKAKPVARRKPAPAAPKKKPWVEADTMVQAWFIDGVDAASMSHATVGDVPARKQ